MKRGHRLGLAENRGCSDVANSGIQPARFEITERGVDLHVAFTDAQERRIELRIREDAPVSRVRLPLIRSAKDR